jgi:uncharacterized protein YgbK (DUF1537 family)
MTVLQPASPAERRIGIVADDITGSGDIGVMLAKNGLVTRIYSDMAWMDDDAGKQADALIIDTNSRFDTAEIAYKKAYDATVRLKELGCTQFINKTCSVFRGNIGAEFDAMLDALDASFAVVVLGFPKNGRTTVGGIHYVHGKRLEESEFRNDPVHPMTRSDLVGILQEQTKRSVTAIGSAIIDSGAQSLKEAIAEAKKAFQYVILDVTEQAALRTIALAVREEPILCGSSALSEELSALLAAERPETGEQSHRVTLQPDVGILVAAGSLMPQTAAQIAYMHEHGVPVLELDTRRLLHQDECTGLIEGIAGELTAIIRSGRDAIFHSSNDPAIVEATKTAAAESGYTNTEVSRLVSSTIAEIAARVLERTGQRRLLVAGGDTSASVCERLGVKGLEVGNEIEPGLPVCLALTDPPFLLVLKSGSFGKPSFFQNAIEHLKRA